MRDSAQVKLARTMMRGRARLLPGVSPRGATHSAGSQRPATSSSSTGAPRTISPVAGWCWRCALAEARQRQCPRERRADGSAKPRTRPARSRRTCSPPRRALSAAAAAPSNFPSTILHCIERSPCWCTGRPGGRENRKRRTCCGCSCGGAGGVPEATPRVNQPRNLPPRSSQKRHAPLPPPSSLSLPLPPPPA